MPHKFALPLLYIANAISGFAQGITMIAIPWYFTAQNKMSYFNTAYGFATLLVLFFGLYAGTLVDKYSRKYIFIAVNFICFCAIGGIAAYGFSHSLPPILIVTVFVLTMLNYNIHYPTLYALGHEISSPDNYGKINAQIEVVGQSTSILSGAFAGILIEGINQGKQKLFGFHLDMPFAIQKWELTSILMADAFTYLIAGGIILLIPYQRKHRAIAVQDALMQQLKAGFTYLKAHPNELKFGLFSYSVFAALIVSIHALIPVYINTRLHEDGSVFAASEFLYAIGALFAGLFIRLFFPSKRNEFGVVFLTGIAAILYLSLYFNLQVIWFFIFSISMGICNAGTRILRLTYLFNQVPNEYMGRVNSIFNMGNVLTRSIFIFCFSLPFFTFDQHIVYAFLTLAIFLGISALVLIQQNKQIEA